MKLAVTSESFSKNINLVKKLKSLWSGEVKLNTEGIKFTKKELISFLSDSDAAIVGLDIINSDLLNELPKLRYISKYGVGLDNIDLDYCLNHNIKIGWTGGVNKLSVAEMTIAFAITLSRNMYQSSISLKNNQWIKNGGCLLSGGNFGIIGFGNIGKEVYRLLQPFNCNVFINDTDQNAINNFSELKIHSKDEIYENCDVISFHVPLTDETKNLVSKEHFHKFKKKPILINTSRGGIFNEEDILFGLNNDNIRSVALDVFSNEPNPSFELLSHPGVFCTPHIGGNAREAVLAMGTSAIENLLRIINEE